MKMMSKTASIEIDLSTQVLAEELAERHTMNPERIISESLAVGIGLAALKQEAPSEDQWLLTCDRDKLIATPIDFGAAYLRSRKTDLLVKTLSDSDDELERTNNSALTITQDRACQIAYAASWFDVPEPMFVRWGMNYWGFIMKNGRSQMAAMVRVGSGEGSVQKLNLEAIIR